jgi:hypothetical protein
MVDKLIEIHYRIKSERCVARWMDDGRVTRHVGLAGADKALSRPHNPRYIPALDTMSTAFPTIVCSAWEPPPPV